jgi:hypothetical protein
VVRERLERLTTLLLVIALITFGGLSAFHYKEYKYWEASLDESVDEKVIQKKKCQKMVDEKTEYSIVLRCRSDIESVQERIEFSRRATNEHEKMFKIFRSLVFFVPIFSVFLYVAIIWVWVGKLPKLNGFILFSKGKRIFLQRPVFAYSLIFLLTVFIGIGFW